MMRKIKQKITKHILWKKFYSIVYIVFVFYTLSVVSNKEIFPISKNKFSFVINDSR